jgi:hypothetical protein
LNRGKGKLRFKKGCKSAKFRKTGANVHLELKTRVVMQLALKTMIMYERYSERRREELL